ncbi:MAG TPA: hypothetical protein VGQ04_08640 [Chitinophagaceae bacterium]|jgi:hypothetical protein|nr:hypothetical protein [Chitinophagaceae bacterium]
MRKVLRSFLFISLLSLVVVSCEKGTEQFPPVKSQEKPSISLPEGNGLVVAALDISNTVITVDILEIRRDATSPADLNRVQTVKIAKSNSVLSDLSGAAVTELPRDIYQSHPDNPFDGQFWTITFQPGEFVKHLKINLKTLDLVTLGRVGLGFQLASADNGAVLSASQNQVAVEIGAKNQWDGVYKVKYRLFHPTNPGITGNGTIPEWDFLTSGPTSIDWDFATVFINFPTNGLTYFGDATGPSLQVRMTVNPDNTVSLTNVGSQAIALAFPPLVVPPGVTNRYDPATKTFYVAYTWTPAGAGTREKYDTLTYIRPR